MADRNEETIQQATLESGEFLAIHVGDTPSSKTVSNDTIRTKDSEFWFFQVADVADLIEAPITLNDTNGNAIGPLGADSGTDYTRLYDQDGEDSLRNDDDDWITYHFSVGVKQDGIRVYPRIPDNQNGGGFTYLTGSEPDPTTPDPYGYVRSDNTDFQNPNTRLESIAWRTGDISPIQYGFYNDNEVQVDPILSIVGKAYQLRPVTGVESMYQLLADTGKPVGDQQNRVRLVNFSRAALRTFSYDVPEEWKDSQNTLTVKHANLPEEIEAAIEGDSSSGSGSGGSQSEPNIVENISGGGS